MSVHTPPPLHCQIFSAPIRLFHLKKGMKLKYFFFIFYTCKENIYQNVFVFSQYTLTVFIKCITKLSIFPQFFNHWKIPFCLYICHRKYRAHMLKYSDFYFNSNLITYITLKCFFSKYLFVPYFVDEKQTRYFFAKT